MIPEIIKELNKENGSNYKIQVLKNYQDNELLQRVLKMAYDKVAYTYGISMKNINTEKYIGTTTLISLEGALNILENEFSTRKVTGNKAIERLEDIFASVRPEDAQIIKGIINRDLRINMGRTQINKVFKNLIIKPPYMRCGIYSEKTAKKISFPAIIQVKADGMFQAVTVENGDVTFTSRSGEERDFPTLESRFRNFPDGVYIGELLVHNLENRSEGNGLINSDNPPHRDIYIQLWDYITLDEYSRGKDKKNKTEYRDRIYDLSNNIDQDEYVQVIETHNVQDISQALRYVSTWMNQGLEGGILKDLNNIFVDHTSPTQLKLKLEIDAEVRVTGFIEGTKGTKREQTFGSLVFENDEGTIKGSVSGFSDKELEEIHQNREKYLGKVMTVQFNDLTKSRDNDYYALSHPRFICFRDDKNCTDTLERVQEMKEMAMSLS